MGRLARKNPQSFSEMTEGPGLQEAKQSWAKRLQEKIKNMNFVVANL